MLECPVRCHTSRITQNGMSVATYVIALAVPVIRLINVLLEANAINNNEAVHSPFYLSKSVFRNKCVDESSKVYIKTK